MPFELTIEQLSKVSGGDSSGAIAGAAAFVGTALAVGALVVASGGLAAVPVMAAVGAAIAGGSTGGAIAVLAQ